MIIITWSYKLRSKLIYGIFRKKKKLIYSI